MAVWSWPRARVVRVVDGDSIIAELTKRTPLTIDIGFHGSVDITHVTTFGQRLRLNRINAKPAKSVSGTSATDAVKRLTLDVVDIDTVGPYKYRDEWMAEVTLPDGTNLSDYLVQQGLAVYWDGTGPRPDA